MGQPIKQGAEANQLIDEATASSNSVPPISHLLRGRPVREGETSKGLLALTKKKKPS